MLKLVFVVLLYVCVSEAAISSLHLLVPSDSHNILAAGKSPTHSVGNTIPSLSNAISEEDKSSKGLSEESNESTANTAASSAPASASLSSASNAPAAAAGGAGSAPAALTRAKLPSSASSSITSTSGLSKGSVLISSTAQASSSSSSSASARSSATIQHRILPAESIPLPITISTRAGLRTVIAPETLTIHQPGIAKVGEVVQQIPTAVSHQRQTVVHNHARVVTPIVAPAVRTVSKQVVRAYHTPLVYAPHIVEN